MSSNKQSKIAVILLNWNGEEDSLACIESLKKQTIRYDLIAVDNGSADNFVSVVKKQIPKINLLENSENLGFSGGVNTGIRYALEKDYEYVALINNDAKPDKTWLEELLRVAEERKAGIVTGRLLKTDGTIDSTGDMYTSWGLPYPRGRNDSDSGIYNHVEEVFAGSGGASLYNMDMLREIGLFDEDFFAYYEDVDLSFRAQLAGWKVLYTPKAIAYHKIGASSAKIPGFTTYVTVRNLPWLLWKNVPWRLMPIIWPRFFIAYSSIILSSLAKGKIVPVFKGIFIAFFLFPKKLIERNEIQSIRKVPDDYIKSIVTYDLPPNATKLRNLRSFLRKLRFWK